MYLDCKTWSDYLCQDGSAGGFSACAPKCDEELDRRLSRDPNEDDWSEAIQETNEVHGKVSGLFRKVKPRRAPPTRAFPAGAWGMMFLAQEFKSRAEAGLGQTSESWDLGSMRHCLFMILVAVRFHVEAPLIWHCSQAFTLSKGNGKIDCAGLGLAHSLDPFGK
eukprot:6466171-Pyramimonas_sp.AAC.1